MVINSGVPRCSNMTFKLSLIGCFFLLLLWLNYYVVKFSLGWAHARRHNENSCKKCVYLDTMKYFSLGRLYVKFFLVKNIYLVICRSTEEMLRLKLGSICLKSENFRYLGFM